MLETGGKDVEVTGDMLSKLKDVFGGVTVDKPGATDKDDSGSAAERDMGSVGKVASTPVDADVSSDVPGTSPDAIAG